MKKLILTFGALLLLALYSYSQIPSSVVVFSQEGERFYVVVDGIRQNTDPQTNVRVTRLTGPKYLFKVIFENTQIPSIDKNVMTRDVDGIPQDMTYVIKKNNKGEYDMKINSFEPARGEGYTPVQGQYTVPVSSTGQQVQVTTTTVEQNVVTDPNAVNMNVNAVDPVTGESINMNVNMNVTGVETQSSSTTVVTSTTTTTTTGGNVIVDPVQADYYVMPGYSGPIGCHWPMSEIDFGSAMNSISTKSFEDDKLIIAKQILGSNCMTCEQIKKVMLAFSFEDSRLDFAKYAYGYVYDPGNFYKLNDAFTFSSSIDELNNYINGR